eukprot:3821392-Amphidinium_carterae.1
MALVSQPASPGVTCTSGMLQLANNEYVVQLCFQLTANDFKTFCPPSYELRSGVSYPGTPLSHVILNQVGSQPSTGYEPNPSSAPIEALTEGGLSLAPLAG